MSTIKNIHKLSGILTPEQIAKLEAGAGLHRRHSNIEFKILDVKDQPALSEMTVRVTQGKHLSGNYADIKTLIDRTRELFKPFVKDRMIYVHAFPFLGSIIDSVTPEWLSEKMLKKGVKITDIVTDTGIDRTNISAWINGKRPMSQIVKAMFYFYFTR